MKGGAGGGVDNTQLRNQEYGGDVKIIKPFKVPFNFNPVLRSAYITQRVRLQLQ